MSVAQLILWLKAQVGFQCGTATYSGLLGWSNSYKLTTWSTCMVSVHKSWLSGLPKWSSSYKLTITSHNYSSPVENSPSLDEKLCIHLNSKELFSWKDLESVQTEMVVFLNDALNTPEKGSCLICLQYDKLLNQFY